MLDIFVLSFTLFHFPTATPYICSDGEVTIANRSSGYFCDGRDVETGIFSVCVNGSYVPVCSNGLSSQDAQNYCQYYFGSNTGE